MYNMVIIECAKKEAVELILLPANNLLNKAYSVPSNSGMNFEVSMLMLILLLFLIIIAIMMISMLPKRKAKVKSNKTKQIVPKPSITFY